MGDLDEIKERISKAMASQGTYTPDFDLCIELCAGVCLAFRIALSDISQKRMKTYVKEKTREDNKKRSVHPAFKVLFDASEAARRQLRELGLTPQTHIATEADEVNDLINKVDKAGDVD